MRGIDNRRGLFVVSGMILGLLSDTHGHVARTRRAAEILVEADVGAVVHCGDIGSEPVLVELAEVLGARGIPVTAVLGNVDLFDAALLDFPAETGVSVVGRKAELELAGKRLGVAHGDDTRLLIGMINAGACDYVFTGHTHVASDTREGATRVINPGAVYRAAQPSLATLDLAEDRLTVMDLP